MTDSKVSLMRLHFDHEAWANELNFFQDDLAVLKKYNDEVARKNNSDEAMRGVESFQNKLIRQQEVLDILRHDVKIAEEALVTKIKSLNDIQVQKLKDEDHPALRDEVDTFKKLYGEFRNEYLEFVGKWM